MRGESAYAINGRVGVVVGEEEVRWGKMGKGGGG